jgi:prophage tail gpP-like protein
VSGSLIDSVRAYALGTPSNAGDFDFNFSEWTSFSLSHSITGPAEASLELGDDTGYNRIEAACELGSSFYVTVNDRSRIVGRVEARNSSLDSGQSSTQQFVVRTRMTDAVAASAPQGLQLKRSSIKDFVLGCYEAIGLEEVDFDFQADVSRDLMTGRTSRGQRTAPNLEPLKEDQAKVNPPETVYSAVDRHLRRHGLLHWDGADGRIVVAAPDDTQEPIATLRSFRAPNGQYNNVRSASREQNVSDAPTVLGVFGIGGGRDFSRARVSSTQFNADLIARGFRRAAVIVDEAVRTKQLAERRARREFSLRSRGLERITVSVDGLSYREGSELLPWSPDTVVDVIIEQLGGALGAYYVEAVTMNRTASDADSTTLSLVRQGTWVL